MNRIGEARILQGTPLAQTTRLAAGPAPSPWAWCLTQGQADLFYACPGDGALDGSLTHLRRLSAGALVFNIGMPLHLHCLEASSLCELNRHRFEACLAEAEGHAPFIAAVEAWVIHLLDLLYPEPASTKGFALPPGSISKLKGGNSIFPEAGLLWVRINRGRALRGGQAGARRTFDHGFLPLTPHHRLILDDDCELEARTTSERRDTGELYADLDRFNSEISGLLLDKHRSKQAEAMANYRKRKAHQQHKLDRSIQQMTTVLEPSATPHPAPAGDPFFDACRQVASAMGLNIPQEAQPEPGHPDPLRVIAGAAGFRYRQVALSDEWWRSQKTPLLGFLKPQRQPIAILPVKGQGVHLCLPDQSREKVDRHTQSQLEAEAYQFYEPLATSQGPGTLFQFLKKNIGSALGFIAICGLLGSVMGLIYPLAMSHALNHLVPSKATGQILVLMAGLLACGISSSVFAITRLFANIYLENQKAVTLRAAIWDRILSLPLDFFRSRSSGDLLTRIDAVNAFSIMVLHAVTGFMVSCIFGAFYLGLLFYYSSGLALASLILILFALIPAAFIPKLTVLQRAALREDGLLSSQIQQFILGVSKLRGAAAENRAQAAWAQRFTQKEKALFKMGRLENLVQCWNADFHNFSRLVLYSTMVALLISGRHMPVGDFIAFSAAFAFLIAAINDLSETFVTLSTSAPAYARAKPILQTTLERVENKPHPGKLEGTIQLQQVVFRYRENGPAVLDRIDIHIPAHKMVAIAGPSGCGKSTLVRLLLGFEKPQSGSIHFDGKPLTDFDINGFREQTGVVLQNGGLFLGTILENILGAQRKTEREAWEAAALAGIDQEIKALPMGMHTFLHEGGTSLSGGQIQRLLIARALITKPKILILDEATSALDNQTQALVAKNLAKLAMTRIVIAHRLTTVKNADQILVMDRGRIRQTGTFETLLAEPGIFRELVENQMVGMS